MDDRLLLLTMGAFARLPSRNSLSVHDVPHKRPLSTIFVYDSLCSRVALLTNLTTRLYESGPMGVCVAIAHREKDCMSCCRSCDLRSATLDDVITFVMATLSCGPWTSKDSQVPRCVSLLGGRIRLFESMIIISKRYLRCRNVSE